MIWEVGKLQPTFPISSTHDSFSNSLEFGHNTLLFLLLPLCFVAISMEGEREDEEEDDMYAYVLCAQA